MSYKLKQPAIVFRNPDGSIRRVATFWNAGELLEHNERDVTVEVDGRLLTYTEVKRRNNESGWAGF